MSQRSLGDAHAPDEPATTHSTTEDSLKSVPNPIIQHPIHSASTSNNQIHKRFERFRQDIHPNNGISRVAEAFEDGELVSRLLCRGKKSSVEQAASSKGWVPSASKVADRAEGLNIPPVAHWYGKSRLAKSYVEVVRGGTTTRHQCSQARVEQLGPSPTTNFQRKVWFTKPTSCSVATPRASSKCPAMSLEPTPSTNLSHLNPKHHDPLLSRTNLADTRTHLSPIHQSTPIPFSPSPERCNVTRNCFGDDWQLVSQRRTRRNKLQPSPWSSSTHQYLLRQAIYLNKIRGKCFNCLASDHRVAQCRNPTKCWVCQRSGHISYRCPSRQPSSCNSPSNSSTSPNSGIKLADAASPELLLGTLAPPQVQLLERDEDPMRLDAELVCPQILLTRNAKDKVVFEDLSFFDVMVANQHWHVQNLVESGDHDIQLSEVAQGPHENSHSPFIVRNEEEQLIGHQLIQNLSNFKRNMEDPLSPFSLNTSFGKETIGTTLVGNQRHSQKPKNKTKSQKTVITIVRDMLTKKWTFVRKDKKLDDLTLKPLSTSNFEAFKKLSKMTLFLEVMRKLTEAAEKRKKTSIVPI